MIKFFIIFLSLFGSLAYASLEISAALPEDEIVFYHQIFVTNQGFVVIVEGKIFYSDYVYHLGNGLYRATFSKKH